MKQMTLTLFSMYSAASQLGYSLPFMNEICKRAFWSGRPFLVLKDEKRRTLHFLSAMYMDAGMSEADAVQNRSPCR